MLILIIGGSGSGKSEIAEKICTNLKSSKLYYIATMKIWDKECEKRVQKHKIQRKNKGFITVEAPENIENSINSIEKVSTALLECIGNLIANEQFSENSENPVKKICNGLEILQNHIENLIIVSNEVFSDSLNYDSETIQYIKNIAEINKNIARKADIVVEICCGLPIIYKGKELFNEIFN